MNEFETTETPQLIKVSIVDDHKMFTDAIAKSIDDSGKVKVIAKYYDLESCRQGLETALPDVLLLDIDLPDGDGVAFCAKMRKTYKPLKIIMLTMYSEFNIIKHARLNGALGYVLKNADLSEILDAIETVHAGEPFLSGKLELLMEDKEDTDVIRLTNREQEILRYTAKGYTAKETARALCRDLETVKTCRHNLFIKLDVKNVAELITTAYQMKLL
jgi:DNA-binding NarL/FixJ family response regulator